MGRVRGIAWIALGLGFAHTVFGAVVRITGSGLGCGDSWPKCQGHWIPPFSQPALVIEVSHRYLAATLTAAIVGLVLATWRRRGEAWVGGRGGVFRPALLAGGLVLTTAIFGAITVWMALANKLVIVTHLALAMSLLAVLVVAVVRAGGPPQIPSYVRTATTPSPFERHVDHRSAEWTASPASARVATVAAALGFLAVALGALTANIPGANVACLGFPLCRGGLLPTDTAQYLQFVHRIVAYSLFLLVGWAGVVFTQRRERRLAAFARIVLTVIFLQIAVAATMVEFHLPPVWRSLHEGVGTLLWIVVFAFGYVAHQLAHGRRVEHRESAAVVATRAEARA